TAARASGSLAYSTLSSGFRKTKLPVSACHSSGRCGELHIVPTLTAGQSGECSSTELADCPECFVHTRDVGSAGPPSWLQAPPTRFSSPSRDGPGGFLGWI